MQHVIMILVLTYSSVVSSGMREGTSFSPCLLHLTTVPVQVHLGGQYARGSQLPTAAETIIITLYQKNSLSLREKFHIHSDQK